MLLAHSYPAFILTLQERLAKVPLPGHEAHFKMAHAVRRADPNPDPASTRDAAILITFFEKNPGDWHLVMIRRTASPRQDKHAGQIAFPGGKMDPGDRDLMYTALREAEEEVALDLTAIDVLGQLSPLYITVSRFMVHPFVAYSWTTPLLTRQEREIEEILELPFKAFLDPDSRQETRINLGSGIVLNHVPAFQIQGHIIWGATAMILSELIEILGTDL